MKHKPLPPHSPPRYPDEADEPQPDARGEVARGIVQLITEGRTASARLLRAETLAHLLRVGGAQSVAEIARRCQCSERRVFAVLSELRKFIGQKR